MTGPTGPDDLTRALEGAADDVRDGRLDAARATLAAVLAADPGQPDAIHLLGIVHHERGDSVTGVCLLRSAIGRWPKDDAALAGVWNNLGNMLLETGSLDDAEDAYRAAVALGVDAARPWANLAVLARRRGRLDDAVDAGRAAVAADGDDAHGWFTLSRALVERGDVAEGLAAHAEGVARAPDDAVDREQVARALALLGRRDEAARLYRQWLEEQPDNPVALHHLAACEQRAVPSAASPAYVTAVFDQFASAFDAKLAALDYRAPELVARAIATARGSGGSAADLGCGTGLLGVRLRAGVDRLVGVDLSVPMLREARRRGVYDALYRVELGDFLRNETGRFDIVASADVLCYLGDLATVVRDIAAALRPGGVAAFTVEALDDATAAGNDGSDSGGHGDGDGWALTLSGRYAHRPAYVERLLGAAGFIDVVADRAVLRYEAGLPVGGAVVSARRR